MKSRIKIFSTIYLVVVFCSSILVNGLDNKVQNQAAVDDFKQDSPHKVLQHLDNHLTKITRNITQNPQVNEKLNLLAKQLVSSVLTKIDTQAKIARLTREALQSVGLHKGVTAIETRRILDYISRTMSSQILSFTRASSEPEIHRLVYGLSQTASEVAIISALKDVTYASAMSRKQVVDTSFRRKRSIVEQLHEGATSAPLNPVEVTTSTTSSANKNQSSIISDTVIPSDQFSVVPINQKKSIQILKDQTFTASGGKGFLNQTILDIENNGGNNVNDSDALILKNTINSTNSVKAEEETDWVENVDSNLGLNMNEDFTDEMIYRPALSDDVVAEMEIGQTEADDDSKSDKKIKQKIDRLESKARKAIMHAGDVAYLTAASVVALRRALTASIEVQMSIKYAKNGLSNHQELMMNLAKTAAQQAGKEAKSATSKSLACERALQLAIKYTTQSNGAKLNHIANRMITDAIALSSIAKSMAYVSSEIAMNSLYQVTDLKPTP